MKIALTLILTCLGLLTFGQAPLINSVAPLNTSPQARVVITGSGFSSTPAQLAVYFDNIKANVVSSSAFSIQVDVPPQARMSNVQVINLATGLSGKSSLKFMESFGGTAFDPAKVAAPITFAATKELFDICTCDFDLDGKPDLGATKFAATDDPAASDLLILKNQSTPGTMSFTQFDKTNLPALNVSFPTINIDCGDLDGDGKPDLIATRTGATKNVVFFLRNTNTVSGTLSFAAVQSLFLDVSQNAVKIAIRDLNLDGKPELIISNSFDDPATDNMVYVFVNQSTPGTISFNATPVKLLVTGANTSYGLDVQDLDGDGKPDIIVNQFQSNDIFILRNQSTNLISFASAVKLTSPGTYSQVGTADLNNDGLIDIMGTSTIDNTLRVFINQSTSGNISFKAPSSLTTSTQPWGIDISDVDGDGDVDIVIAAKQANIINVFLSDGAATPAFTRSDIATAKFPRNLKVGDLDGDAKPDFAFTSAASTTGPFSLDIIRNTNCVNPKILNPAGLTLCPPQTIDLLATPAFGVTYDWKESGVSFGGNTSTVTISAAGNYTVTITGESGACALTSPVFAVTNPGGAPPANPIIGANPNPVCVGGTLALSTSNPGGVTFQWTGPDGFSSTSQNPSIPNVTIAKAGLYKLQLTSAGGCKSNEVSQNVDVASFPSFIIGSNTALPACITPGVTLTVNSVSGYTYQWLKDGVLTGQTGLSIPVTVEGDYSVQATNTLLSCSTETPKTTVQLYTVPVAGFTMPATACTNAVVNFTSTATVDPRATVVYGWTFGDAGTATAANPTHTYTTAGAKSVTQTVSYNGVSGCSNPSTQPINITNGTVPVITAPVTQSCPGESVVLSLTGTFNTIAWSTGGTGTTETVTQPGTYTVNTVDANTCAGNASFVLASGPVPTLTVSADKTSISTGGTAQLTASGADTYLWSPAATLDNPAIANPIASPTTTTTYKVVGTLTAGCSASDSVKITVTGANSIPAPLIFTPNGDADNDLWKIPGIENYPDCTMTIYDGHGSSVYEQKGYKSDWDGTNNGKPLPEATYFYVFSCPDKQPITGTVLIKR